MTQAKIKERIALFIRIIEGKAQQIRQAGNDSWAPIKRGNETQRVRAFLTKKNAGIDYLNKNLVAELSADGRVVKFAGVFLHGTPMVEGWTKKPKGRKKLNGVCELADLQTVFLYLDSGNTIRQMRCVLFQAKMQPDAGTHVINEPVQRQLYDECEGFSYVNNSVANMEEERRLPKGANRKKALQYLFVEPQPPKARTIPSAQKKGRTSEYGEHLFQFFSNKTGLNAGTKKSAWGKIAMELMENVAGKVYTDKKVRGKGIKDLLKAFNNFESHKTWCIDSGASDDGFGVQLVIVWDGDIPPAEPQEDVLPKVPVRVMIENDKPKQKVAIEEEELETMEEPAVLEVELG